MATQAFSTTEASAYASRRTLVMSPADFLGDATVDCTCSEAIQSALRHKKSGHSCVFCISHTHRLSRSSRRARSCLPLAMTKKRTRSQSTSTDFKKSPSYPSKRARGDSDVDGSGEESVTDEGGNATSTRTFKKRRNEAT